MERDIGLQLLADISLPIFHIGDEFHLIKSEYIKVEDCPVCKLKDWIKSITILVD